MAFENNDTHNKTMFAVWDFFFVKKKISKDLNGIERVVCNFCKKDFAIEKYPRSLQNYGTSYLIRHVCSCKNCIHPYLCQLDLYRFSKKNPNCRHCFLMSIDILICHKSFILTFSIHMHIHRLHTIIKRSSEAFK